MNMKLQRRFGIVCLILMIITPFTTSYAASVKECGQALADYALSFAEATTAENSTVQTHYAVSDWASDTSERAYAYKDQEGPNCKHKVAGSDVTDLGMDCVGWISYAVHHCYGIGGDSLTFFVTPQSGAYAPFTDFKYSTDNVQVGDILISSHHVMIYVGNGKIVDSLGSRETEGRHPGVAVRNVPSDVTKIARITETGAAGISSFVTTYNGTGVRASGGIINGKDNNYSNFYFYGIPDGKYSLATGKNIFEIIVDLMKNLLNFFTGLLTYLFRGVMISFISIFDRLINNTFDSVNGTPKTLQDSGVTATSADDPTNRSVTIEGLIFNEIDLFDINIFQVENNEN